tara:strand:+ start:689 stop:1666 length:978 start_codon:yes stop_codon:yes gene_type:complete
MKTDDYYSVLNNYWEKIKIEKTKNTHKAIEIFVFGNFWFSENKNNLPGLIIKLNNNKIHKSFLTKAKGWEINQGEKTIEMYLNNKNHKDFFIKVINLIITKIYFEKLSDDKSIEVFFEELNLAKDFFEDEGMPKKLKEVSQIGLFGEINTLNNLLTKKLSIKDSLLSWTGPFKKHDFTTTKVLLEIKTTVTSSRKINTSSTNQISPTFEKDLFIIFIQLSKAPSGISLNQIIDEFYEKLKNESMMLANEFLLKLAKVKYFATHKNEYTQKYSVDKTNYFEVRNDFPYIKKVEIPDELSDLSITYKIDLEKCEDFRINEEQLLNKI